MNAPSTPSGENCSHKRAERPGASLSLAFRPPLDFPLMLDFLRKRTIPGIERISMDAYERVLAAESGASFIRVTANPLRPELKLEIENADPRAIPEIVRQVRRVFDLDADPDAIAEVLNQDPLLGGALEKRPGLRVPGGWDGFEVAARAVLGQQISVVAATTLAGRLVDRFGSRIGDGRVGLDRVFPTPAQLCAAPVEAIGLPRTRACTIRTLATAVMEGRVHFGADQDLGDFVDSLVALPGIGPWTAHYLAMRGLGQADAFPAGDLVLQQVLGGDRRLSERETEARSQAWRPWRAYAVLQLWHLANDAKSKAQGLS